MNIKHSFESASQYENKVCKYSCQYTKIEDIIEQFNENDKLVPYLEHLTEHPRFFANTNTIVFLNKTPFLFAENKKPKSSMKDMINVLKIVDENVDEKSEDLELECIIV